MSLHRKWLLSCPGRRKEFEKLMLLIFIIIFLNKKKNPTIEISVSTEP